MTGNVVRLRGISGGFILAVAILFALQVGALFWFGRSTNAVKPIVVTSPTFKLGDSRPQELAALEDPTLFVLPHVQSFPNQSWIKPEKRGFEPKAWDEPLRWLNLPGEKLGAAFLAFVQSLPALSDEGILPPEPTVTYPSVPAARPVETPSRLRIEGDLASRRLLQYPPLPAQATAGDRPPINIVQVLVDAQGNVVSALLIEPGSGSADADEDAVNIAKSLRFDSVEITGPERMANTKTRLTLGNVIFEWQTAPSTNAPVLIP